jgi:hypothetical protein
VGFEWTARSFDTASLKIASPEEYIRKHRIPKQNYPRVFKIVKGTPGWKPSATLATALRGTIFGREEAQKYYHALPASDSRRNPNDVHQGIIDVFKAGKAMLLEGETGGLDMEKKD